jgi:predicted nucleic acid-binding protein
MRVYADSDLLIWHLRGESKAMEYLKSLRQRKNTELWIGAMQRAEAVFFMRPKEHESTLFFLSLFKTAPVDQAIVDSGAELYRQWNPSHGTDINDAILAATVMRSGGEIHGLNKRHYPMPHLKMIQAW